MDSVVTSDVLHQNDAFYGGFIELYALCDTKEGETQEYEGRSLARLGDAWTAKWPLLSYDSHDDTTILEINS